MQSDNSFKIRNLKIQLTAAVFLFFILIIGFLAVYDLKPGQPALALSGYTGKTGLTAADWEKLPADFVAKGGDTMAGNLILNDKLGIGASNPNKQIHIYNASSNAEIDLQSFPGAGNHWGVYNERSYNSLRFWRGDDKMVITNDGKVGIGIDTSNPSAPYARLHVNGGNLYVTDNGNSPFILLGDSQAGGEFGLLKWDSANDKLYLGTSAGGDTIAINESGNVGIGVADPQAKLDVGGDLRVRNNTWSDCVTIPSTDGNQGKASCPEGKYMKELNFGPDQRNEFSMVCCGL